MGHKTPFITVAWTAIFVLLLAVVLVSAVRASDAVPTVGYSEFLELVRNKQIEKAVIQESQGGTEIIGIFTDGRKVHTTATYLDRGLVGDLINNGVKFDVKPREEGSLLATSLVNWGPILLITGLTFVLWCWTLIAILRSEFKDGVTKICWLLAAIFLPVLGSILYFLFGRFTKINSTENK